MTTQSERRRMNAVDNANAAGGSGETTPHEARPLWDVIREHMDRRGIEDVEELHRRFVETEHAYIPVPGRHRGKPVSLEEFKRHVRGEYPAYYGQLTRGLAEVLEIATESEEVELVYSYLFGTPVHGIHPTREL
jgi:hypothetical protein